MKNRKIRLIYLYEFKLGHKATEACTNINSAFGKGTVNVRTVQRWFDKFCSGNTSLKEKDGRGQPTSVDNNLLRALVEANPKTTVRELSIELGVSHVTVVSHLKEIGKRKKLDKWVPHHLTDNHQNRRLEVASSLLLRHRNEPFLKRIMTCDEKWIFFDNTRRGGQWLDIDELPRHFPKQDLFPKKVMVSVWWGVTGIIHYSFLKRGETRDG